MSYSFDPEDGLVVIKAELQGPSGSAILRLALDTGATRTLVNAALLTSIGYDPAISPNRYEVTTGSGVEYVPRVVLTELRALGQKRSEFAVLCHTLPPSSGVDGVLGVDFFRRRILKIDFRAGKLSVG